MPRKSTPVRRAVAAIAVACTVLLAACGGGSGDGNLVETLAAAADTTAAADTVRTRFVITFEDVPGAPDDPIVTDGVSTMDGKRARGTTSQLGEDIEYLVVDEAYYYSAPGLPGGAEWLRMSFDDLKELSGIDMAAATDQSTTEALGRLRAAAGIEEVGDEEIDGVATTHYRGAIDVDRMADEADFLSDEAIEAVRGMFGDSYAIDVWIDGDGFMRRMRYFADLSTAPDLPAGLPSEGRLVFEMSMSDFGEPIDVTAPPDEDVVDYADIN